MAASRQGDSQAGPQVAQQGLCQEGPGRIHGSAHPGVLEVKEAKEANETRYD